MLHYVVFNPFKFWKSISILLTLIFIFHSNSPIIFPQSIDETSPACDANATDYQTGRIPGQFEFADEARNYSLYVPEAYQPSEPMPLVIALHGVLQTNIQMRGYSGFLPVADEQGFMVVYPTSGIGKATAFASGKPLSWNVNKEPDDEFPDDVGFISALIDELSSSYCIDPARIYATGFQNGADMANRLACELSDQIAAIGTVSSQKLQEDNTADPYQCEPENPVPVITFFGRKSVALSPGVDRYPVEQWAEDWATRNECDMAFETLEPIGQVEGIHYMNCKNNADVIVYMVNDAGMSWPGATAIMLGEEANQDVNAAQMIWEFFAAHSLVVASPED